jgi:hypothetical protein
MMKCWNCGNYLCTADGNSGLCVPCSHQSKLEHLAESIKPLIDLKCKLYATTQRKISLLPDGTLQYDYNLTNDQQQTLNLIDSTIAMLQGRLKL